MSALRYRCRKAHARSHTTYKAHTTKTARTSGNDTRLCRYVLNETRLSSGCGGGGAASARARATSSTLGSSRVAARRRQAAFPVHGGVRATRTCEALATPRRLGASQAPSAPGWRQHPVARPCPVDRVRSAAGAHGVQSWQRPSRATDTTMRSSASACRCRPVSLPRQALPAPGAVSPTRPWTRSFANRL